LRRKVSLQPFELHLAFTERRQEAVEHTASGNRGYKPVAFLFRLRDRALDPRNLFLLVTGFSDDKPHRFVHGIPDDRRVEHVLKERPEQLVVGLDHRHVGVVPADGGPSIVIPGTAIPCSGILLEPGPERPATTATLSDVRQQMSRGTGQRWTAKREPPTSREVDLPDGHEPRMYRVPQV
jgi:hypothetical protein